MYSSIKPGQKWLDTSGNVINAHGGGMFYEDDTFYWYGENKEKTDGICDIWTWGIKCYSSKDLYNWEDRGLIVEPNTENKDSILHPNKRMDRPHIIYNEKTKKYVCWIKFSGDEACFAVLQSNNLLGPYNIINERIRPFEKKVGDFDLKVDETSKIAYLYFDGDHNGVTCAELTEDYLNVTNSTSRHYENMHPPFTREGVTIFERNQKIYMVTSGMTGYIPNPSDVAIAQNWHGNFAVQGNPHVNDNSNASFNSQISYIFKHPKKKDLYIAMADRWVPDFKMTAEKYDVLMRSIASRFDNKYSATNEEKATLQDMPFLKTVNTSLSTYVWLPLRFEGEKLYIDWHNEWTIEDYE
jgi:hypothetical protein